MTAWKLAILNLSRRPLPTFIAIFAIAISVACSGILLRLNQLSQDRFRSMGRGPDAIVGAKAGGIDILLNALNGEGEYPGYLPMKLFESLKAAQNVHFEDGANAQPTFLESIVPFVYFAKAGPYRVVGTDESFFRRPHSEDNLQFAKGSWSSKPSDVVLGADVATRLNKMVGDSIQIESWNPEGTASQKLEMPIHGVLARTHSAWDRMLYSDLSTAQAILRTENLSTSSIWGPNVLNYFLIYLRPGGFPELSSLINRRTVGQAILVETQKERLQNLTGTGETLGLFVQILILSLSALSLTAMLVTRFEAMSLQLAVLRAIGYSKTVIGSWLLLEGFLIGLSACLLGMILDGLCFPLMRGLLSGALPSPEVIGSSILQSYPVWATALIATTASVFLPLYRVYRQDVHFSLRS